MTKKLTRQEMIDELMEGVAFEEDREIERALSRFASMSDAEIEKEYKEWMGL